ncbi:MAG: Mth938-like domain-containing protein [Nitrosomonadales bacterium]|nr:Mth938-like domain-containing protein [Nitrosomonadales bacterium]
MKQQKAQFYPRRPCTANAIQQIEGAFLKLQLADHGDTKLFTAYGADHVMVNGERHGRSIVVLAEEVRDDWNAAGFDALDETHFAWFLALKPDVLLLGTGARQRFPHPRLYRALTDAGIGMECMNTPAACRTYNILVAEGRKVVAAILF